MSAKSGVSGMLNVNAQKIVSLLATKHAGDVFVPECKNGPSITRNHLRLDAWAMKKSWSNPRVFGYEIKVSRSDFLKDDKWQGYLKYCTDFYFVCPSKLIMPEELPVDVGLIWLSATGTRLFTKRKAAFRDNEIPNDLYRYILMSRVTINDECAYQNNDKEFWEKWLKDKIINQQFGGRVSKAISQHYWKEFDRLQKNNDHLKIANERLENVKKRLDEMGLNSRVGVDQWGLDQKLKELKEGIPRSLKINIRNTITNLTKIQTMIESEENKVATNG